MSKKNKIKNSQAGFTLIEMIVATSIFTVVMLITIGSLLSLNDSSRKAQALRTVIDNLNFAVEDMGRKIRTGNHYRCYPAGEIFAQIDVNSRDCTGDPAGYIITLQDQDGYWVAYKYDSDSGSIMERKSELANSITLEQNWSAITSPEVDIQKMEFRVIGSEDANHKQPMVILNISGVVDLHQEKLRSDFSLQTAISKRGTE